MTTCGITLGGMTPQQAQHMLAVYAQLMADGDDSYESAMTAPAPINDRFEKLAQYTQEEIADALQAPVPVHPGFNDSAMMAPPKIQQPAAALDSAPQIDAVGVPWRADLHAATKGKTKAGEWMIKKGADKDAAKAWRDQHVRGGAKPMPTPAALNQQFGAPPVTTLAPHQLPAPAWDVGADGTMRVGQSAPLTYQPAPSNPVPQPVDYGTWYNKFAELWQSGRLTEAKGREIDALAGVPDASHYASNDHARAISFAELQRL